MVDVGSITAAIGSIRAAADIAKGFLDLKEAAGVQGRVIELQSAILAAQSSALAAQSDQMAMSEQIRELKAKLAELEAWENEKKRYALRDFGGNTFAYELKPEEARSEPAHRLCPSCFELGRKAILQFRFRNAAQRDVYICNACKSEFPFGHPVERQLSARPVQSSYF